MTGEDQTTGPSNTLNQRLDVDFAIQSAELGVWEIDPKTNQVLWDKYCQALVGLDNDAPLPFDQAIQYIHPDDFPRVMAALQQVMVARLVDSFDETYRTVGDDAIVRWVRFWGKARVAPNGELVRFAGIAQDVTVQRLAYRKLEEREQTLRTVIDHVPPTLSICLLIGLDFVIQAPNQTFIDTIHKGSAIEGKPLREVMPELDGQPFFNLLTQVYSTGQSFHSFNTPALIIKHEASVQQYFNASYVPLKDATGQVYGILNTSFEVTEQVLIQQALERQQAQQRFLLLLSDSLRSLRDPLAVYYQTACLVGEYLGANRVGYAEDQGDGDTIVVLRNYVNGVSDLEGTYQYADYGPLLAEFRAGRTVVRADIAQDPTLTPVEKEAHRVLELGATLNKPLSKNGRLMAVLFIHFQQAHEWSANELNLLDLVAERLVAAIDRTQSEQALRQSESRYRELAQQLEIQVQQRISELAITNQNLAISNQEYAVVNQELAESNSQLNRSNDNLQQFAYIASHDLQEPLRKIQSFGDILKTRLTGSISSEDLSYLERMQLAASRMSTLIKDLLSYSRISTQRSTNELVALDEVVATVLDVLEVAINSSGAQVQIDQLPIVLGDAIQLGQLFQNLIGNAIKFHRPDLTPHIHVTNQLITADVLPPMIKPARPAPTYHLIEVIDNGVGFDEKYLDRIFQVFQRLHGKNQYAGTGVGLAICEKVVTNHGGAITARSEPGQGATFNVYLPA
ncbi:PAS domain-containing sensor histidine kinase [Spirosoma rhododendri]|uniref:histidine kinase n=1 Tax=Spirosoma rhododendri TaxID=2728024 RepID=A0A7L5DT63_9BACT|nr:ATP-binding protein [Spirosoma rhododendri]QJD81654.1 PAS domain-containing protein [Spirosoma rhododendri]